MGKKFLLRTQRPTFVPRFILVAWRVNGGEILNVFDCAAAVCGLAIDVGKDISSQGTVNNV